MKKTLLPKVACVLFLLFSGLAAHAQLTASILSQTNVSCYNSCNGSLTASATGGVVPYSYSWQPGNYTTSSISGLCAGTYTLVVTDAAAATATVIATITQPTPITVTINSSNPNFCSGSSTNLSSTASGGTGAYTYSWSPASSLSNANIPSPIASPTITTTYTLTVTDANNCTATATTTVTVFPLPVLTISGGGTICNGSCATFVASGAVTYVWTPGSFTTSSPTLCPTTSTTYTLTGSSMNGCVSTSTATITVAPSPVATITNVIPATCNVNNASAVVFPTGGNSPYVYSWMPDGTTTATASNLPGQTTQTVTVTDMMGCTATVSITPGDSCDYVWPGDANDDAVANNLDILDIGVANGATGTVRANASTTWIGQPSTAWGTTLVSGTDYKFVDCNGDGVIDPTDTTAVTLNYGLTHTNRFGNSIYNASLPDLSVSIVQDSLGANAPGTLQISLGTSAQPASNIYGLAFTINFDEQQIDPLSFGLNLSSSWLGSVGVNLMGIRHTSSGIGMADVAITRLNHTNASGFGTIAQMGFMTTSLQNGTGAGQAVPVTISNVTVIDAAQSTQQVNTVNDTVVVVDDALITGTMHHAAATATFGIAPNPFTESTMLLFGTNGTFEVQLFDVSGRKVFSSGLQNGNCYELNRGDLESGIYLCKVITEGKGASVAHIVIK